MSHCLRMLFIERRSLLQIADQSLMLPSRSRQHFQLQRLQASMPSQILPDFCFPNRRLKYISQVLFTSWIPTMHRGGISQESSGLCEEKHPQIRALISLGSTEQ